MSPTLISLLYFYCHWSEKSGYWRGDIIAILKSILEIGENIEISSPAALGQKIRDLKKKSKNSISQNDGAAFGEKAETYAEAANV